MRILLLQRGKTFLQRVRVKRVERERESLRKGAIVIVIGYALQRRFRGYF